jgi:hypothetical protein
MSQCSKTPGDGVAEIVTNGWRIHKTADLKNYVQMPKCCVLYFGNHPEALMAIYEALGVEITGEKPAAKVHTGDPIRRPTICVPISSRCLCSTERYHGREQTPHTAGSRAETASAL